MTPPHDSQPWWAPRQDDKPVVIEKNFRRRAVFALFTGLFAFVLIAAAFTSPEERPRQISIGITENPPSLDALVATCTGVIDWDDPSELLERLPWDITEGDIPAQISQALSQPPLVRPGFYNPGDADTPSVASLAAYLEAGGTIAWYSQSEDSDNAVAGLETIAGLVNEAGGNYVSVPWPQDKMNRFPSFSRTKSGGRLLFMRWGEAQSCAVASESVMQSFGGVEPPGASPSA